MNDQLDSNQTKDVDKEAPHRGRSLFAPVALIAAGAFFLLANLGIIPQLNWAYAFSYWPLLLIFIGVNILVCQLRAPVGTFLSLLVSLAAVGVFGYLLMSGPNNAAARSLGIGDTTQELKEYPFSVPVEATTSAEVQLDLGNFPTTVADSNAAESLVDGSIWSTGEFVLDVDRDEQLTKLTIGQNSEFDFIFNPLSWFAEPGDRSWEINLNREIPLDLRVDSGNGAATLDLGRLSLSNFRLGSANGSVTATLPDGDYDGQIDSGNGAIRLNLPADGRQSLRVDTGNGSARLLLPSGVPARVEFDTGNGAVSVDGRFDLVEGDSEAGTYETADYSSSGDGILLRMDTGNGSIQISQP